MEIRGDQFEQFQRDAWRRFEEEMVDHARNFSPKQAKVVGDPHLRLAVRSSILRADKYGFSKRGPIRLFLELALLCGSSFDTDPQFMTLSAPLRGEEEQMLRAQQMHEDHTWFTENIPELSAPDALAELRSLAGSLTGGAPAPDAGFDSELLGELTKRFPERTHYIGEDGLRALIQQGRLMASHFGLSTVRETRLMILLMFSFGHECATDPMYPWIGRTLQDETIESSAARTDHLEKRMFAWLEHIVAEPSAKVMA